MRSGRLRPQGDRSGWWPRTVCVRSARAPFVVAAADGCGTGPGRCGGCREVGRPRGIRCEPRQAARTARLRIAGPRRGTPHKGGRGGGGRRVRGRCRVPRSPNAALRSHGPADGRHRAVRRRPPVRRTRSAGTSEGTVQRLRGNGPVRTGRSGTPPHRRPNSACDNRHHTRDLRLPNGTGSAGASHRGHAGGSSSSAAGIRPLGSSLVPVEVDRGLWCASPGPPPCRSSRAPKNAVVLAKRAPTVAPPRRRVGSGVVSQLSKSMVSVSEPV